MPWFDPHEAGVEARILLLLEAPGRRAVGSGFVSPDNDDQTAQNMWTLLREAGIDRRREVVTWNIVPWYIGDGQRIRPATRADLDQARPALRELLSLLPDLRVVVLLGRKAARGWTRAGLDLDSVEAPHPSPLALNTRPAARDAVRAALVRARLLAGRRIAETEFPDEPGVYVVYREPGDRRPLYVGVAATQTLRRRWYGQHLRPRAGGSALRRTLGPYLAEVDQKLRQPERYYPPEIETAISAFLNRCWIELHTTATPEAAKLLEAELIPALDPVLNVSRPAP